MLPRASLSSSALQHFKLNHSGSLQLDWSKFAAASDLKCVSIWCKEFQFVSPLDNGVVTLGCDWGIYARRCFSANTQEELLSLGFWLELRADVSDGEVPRAELDAFDLYKNHARRSSDPDYGAARDMISQKPSRARINWCGLNEQYSDNARGITIGNPLRSLVLSSPDSRAFEQGAMEYLRVIYSV